MEIPKQIVEILERLEKAGFEAYIVGGCVRDGLMGKPAHDYDITTSALPEETEKAFLDCRVVETGIKHGTVTVLYKGISSEITTFRIDGDYPDGRRPEKVTFSKSLTDDLSRRDFTMNAIAYSPKRGLSDPFGGKQDIDKKIIRCVGDPEKRFDEDGLRVLRALRFSSVLGFDIEQKTKNAVITKKEALKNVSPERTFAELLRLLCGENVKKTLLDFPEIFSLIIPELGQTVNYDQNSHWHNSDLYTHTARAVAAAPQNEAIRLAMLLHDIGKPLCRTTDENGESHYYKHAAVSACLADKILRDLHSGTALRERVREIVRLHDMPVETDEKTIKRRLSRMGTELFRDIMYAHIADDSAKIPEAEKRREKAKEAIKTAAEITEKKPCLSLKELAINGSDLKKIIPPSPKMGEILENLLSEVIDGRLENEKEKLLERAEELAGS